MQNCLPRNIRRTLEELPETLDETYERVLKRIGKANQAQVHQLLQCLTVASRSLRVEELAEIFALDFDGSADGIPTLNTNWRSDDQQKTILSACSRLIVVVNEDNARAVKFAHISVKEFLTSHRLANLTGGVSHYHIRLESAHAIIAQACLGILLQLDNNSVDDDGIESSFFLARYAAEY